MLKFSSPFLCKPDKNNVIFKAFISNCITWKQNKKKNIQEYIQFMFLKKLQYNFWKTKMSTLWLPNIIGWLYV